MEQLDLLRLVITRIERLGLAYFVTGSMVTVYFGEPRFTNDIDIVLTLPAERAGDLCRAFPMPDFYVSEDAVRQAIEHRTQFNMIHPVSGLKVDVMIPEDTAFNRSRFARARRVQPEAGYDASFSSPEDVILKKMEYYRDGGSEKHLRDITGMLRIQGTVMDRSYIDEWSLKLKLEAVWEAVQARTDEP